VYELYTHFSIYLLFMSTSCKLSLNFIFPHQIHLTLLHFVTPVIFVYKSWSSSLGTFLQFPAISCHSTQHLPQHPILKQPHANVRSIMWVTVGHSGTTTSNGSVHYILICDSKLIVLQADAGSVIQLTVVHLRLPCGRQWLKVRDGDSLAANLVAHLSGRVTSHSFMSTSNYLLLDFFSDNMPYSCHGSFLARAEQRGNVTCYYSLFHALTT